MSDDDDEDDEDEDYSDDDDDDTLAVERHAKLLDKARQQQLTDADAETRAMADIDTNMQEVGLMIHVIGTTHIYYHCPVTCP